MMEIIKESTHKAGERIHEHWEYTGEKRSVKCYELYEDHGHVVVAYDDMEEPHEILRERTVNDGKD